MNYNPFEKPFASGEYQGDTNWQRFVFDKVLEKGLYIITIYDYNNDDYLTGLLNIYDIGEDVS